MPPEAGVVTVTGTVAAVAVAVAGVVAVARTGGTKKAREAPARAQEPGDAGKGEMDEEHALRSNTPTYSFAESEEESSALCAPDHDVSEPGDAGQGEMDEEHAWEDAKILCLITKASARYCLHVLDDARQTHFEMTEEQGRLLGAFSCQVLGWLSEGLPSRHELGEPVLPSIVQDDLLLLHRAAFLRHRHLSWRSPDSPLLHCSAISPDLLSSRMWHLP